jgi:hypothetical protein
MQHDRDTACSIESSRIDAIYETKIMTDSGLFWCSAMMLLK